jgi:hypothetical protein
MDHEVAAKTHAVERYLLGELPATERDAFEEHYFSCAECAEGVRSGSELTREMKAALSELQSRPQVSSPSWSSWFRMPVLVPTFAALALAFVVGYQNLAVLPDLEAPRSMGPAITLDGLTRSSVPTIQPGAPLRFVTAVENAGSGKLYVELADPSGSTVRAGIVAAPAPGNPLDVYFPGKLAAGRYHLVVRSAKAGPELTRSIFEVVN